MVSEKAESRSRKGAQLPMGAQPAVQLPTPLSMEERNLANNWRIWKSKWIDFSVLARLNEQPMPYRLAMFRHTIGDEARRVLETMQYDKDEDSSDLETIIRKFGDFCEGQTNEIFQRYQFFTRGRHPDESIESYVTELRILARSCNFCKCMADSLIRDRIVFGVNDENITKRLLRQRQLTLNQCLDICYSESSAAHHFQQLHQSTDAELCAVSSSIGKPEKPAARTHEICHFCAVRHPNDRDRCPAWGRNCAKCGKRNHFARCCRFPNVNAFSRGATSSDSEHSVSNVSQMRTKKCVYASLLVGDKVVRFQVGTGATANIIPAKWCPGIRVRPDQGPLCMWNGSKLKPKGLATITVINPKDGSSHQLEFVVVEEELTPILGIDSIQRLAFVHFNHDRFVHGCSAETDISEQYPSVFNPGLGRFEGFAHLSLDPSIRPIALPARRVPFALRDKFATEISNLMELGVIAKIDEPTDWVSQVAIVT